MSDNLEQTKKEIKFIFMAQMEHYICLNRKPSGRRIILGHYNYRPHLRVILPSFSFLKGHRTQQPPHRICKVRIWDEEKIHDNYYYSEKLQKNEDKLTHFFQGQLQVPQENLGAIAKNHAHHEVRQLMINYKEQYNRND